MKYFRLGLFTAFILVFTELCVTQTLMMETNCTATVCHRNMDGSPTEATGHDVNDGVATTGSTSVVQQVSAKKRSETLWLYGITTIVSSVFAALAIVVQLWTCGKSHQSMVFLCHTISLLLMFSGFVLRTFIPTTGRHWAYMSLFAYQYVGGLSSFFWMSVLSFDIWRGFSNLQGLPASHQRNNWRFIAKCAYAWGIPVTLCVLVICIAESPETQRQLNIEMKFTMTWLPTAKSRFIFFFVPIAVLLLENIVFFVLIIINILKASSGTEILNQRNTKLKLFRVYAQLFVVLGLCWFMECVALLCRDLELGVDEAVWYVTTEINLLQGVFVFLIYVCTKKARQKIKQKIPCYSKSRVEISSQKSDHTTTSADGASVNIEMAEVTIPNGNKTSL